MEKIQELNPSCQKPLLDLNEGEKVTNIEENTVQLKGSKQLKRKKLEQVIGSVKQKPVMVI